MTLSVEDTRPRFIQHRTLDFLVCTRCGYSFAPQNYYDYPLGGHGTPQPTGMASTETRAPGREYFMALDAMGILGKDPVSIGIIGAGYSPDHILIRKLPGVTECLIIDLKNFQNSEYFLSFSTDKKFDILIACEVVEHFMDPRQEFSDCFRLLKTSGLFLASTSLKTSPDFSHIVYPFLSGHTSYYTQQALRCLATMNEMFISFGTPRLGSQLLMDKSLLCFTRSKKTHLDISRFLESNQQPM